MSTPFRAKKAESVLTGTEINEKVPSCIKLQKTFVSKPTVQYGCCTPGMIMAANALINDKTEPDEYSIRKHLANNLCRRTGYNLPVKAVLNTVRAMQEDFNS